MTRVCRVCGKEFEGHWARTICSKECKKKRISEKNKEYHERYRQKQKLIHYSDGFNGSEIPANNEKAREQGMSYGYYMAMKEGRL